MLRFINRLASSASSWVGLYTGLGGTLVIGTGTLLGWATWATGIFISYAPFSWISASILGSLVACLGVWIFALAWSQLSTIKLRQRF
jgi:hypothetical protein